MEIETNDNVISVKTNVWTSLFKKLIYAILFHVRILRCKFVKFKKVSTSVVEISRYRIQLM